jgi:hypothetical protein
MEKSTVGRHSWLCYDLLTYMTMTCEAVLVCQTMLHVLRAVAGSQPFTSRTAEEQGKSTSNFPILKRLNFSTCHIWCLTLIMSIKYMLIIKLIVQMETTPSGLVNEVVLDMIWVKHWEYKSWITCKSLSLEMWKLHE